MKAKKILGLLTVFVLSISMLAGCGEENNQESSQGNGTVAESTSQNNEESTEVVTGDTVASDMYVQFQSEIVNNDDLEQVANKLLENEKLADMAVGCFPVEEGYLNGFDAEITGFNEGICFGPMIGTIPFVGYLFQSDTPDSLVADLKSHAQLNWNICTTADEMVVGAKGEYVFFAMAPKSFE